MNPVPGIAPKPPRRSRAWWIAQNVLLWAACSAALVAVYVWANVHRIREQFKMHAAPAVAQYDAAFDETDRAKRASDIAGTPEDDRAAERAGRRLLLLACPQLDPDSEYYDAQEARLLSEAYLRAYNARMQPLYDLRAWDDVEKITPRVSLLAFSEASAKVCVALPKGVFRTNRADAFYLARGLLVLEGEERCKSEHPAFMCSIALRSAWVKSVI